MRPQRAHVTVALVALAALVATSAFAQKTKISDAPRRGESVVAAGEPCDGVATAKVGRETFYCKDGTWQAGKPSAESASVQTDSSKPDSKVRAKPNAG